MLTFQQFFLRIHQREPFPWQWRLANMVAGGQWPDAIHLPTSAGKTALIDVWLWARSMGWPHVPRRLYYLIDRRSLVDAAAEYATKSALLGGVPANVVRLRGGMADSQDEWLLDPSAPAVISTTVDQLGSRLLGRAYGVGRYSAAIHTGLAGNDALIVIDEAHLVEPLRQTLDQVQKLRAKARSPLNLPWHVITMTATPMASGSVLGLDSEDHAHPLLATRFGARKLASLHVAGEAGASAFAARALSMRAAGAGVVGIVVNRVALAREVHSLLSRSGEAMLLIGRARPHERDALGVDLMARCGTQTRITARSPLFVVATQTIEVGLDLDFDALVSELAPVSALRQRFGRLDRLGSVGTSHAAIVSTEGTALPYHQDALDAALKWLKQGLANVKGVGKVVDLGVNAVAAMPAAPDEAGKRAPVLLPADLGLLFDVEVPFDVAPYLHGEVRTHDVTVAWRAGLEDDNVDDWADVVERMLPVSQETLSLPVRAARAWLSGRVAEVSDLETESIEPEDPTKKRPEQPPSARPFVLWDGEGAWVTEDTREIRPGLLVVLPASAGGYDQFGWNPAADDPVLDLMAEGLVQPRRWRGDNTRTTYAVPLATHLKGVGQFAEQFATGCGLSPELAAVLGEAGRLHDIGKNDPRFQLLLGARPNELLAKSGVIDPRITRDFAGLPPGWRHEIASVAARPDVSPLVRYLVGSHHGRGKPWLPARPDADLWRLAGGHDWPALHRQMVDEYGWWGLSLLEALLRLGDWARSVQEQEQAAQAQRAAA